MSAEAIFEDYLFDSPQSNDLTGELICYIYFGFNCVPTRGSLGTSFRLAKNMINDSEQNRGNAAPLTTSNNLELLDNPVLSERELALTEKEQEKKAKIAVEGQNLWFSSPLLIGIASAVFGVIGTAIGAGLQGYSNFQLERQKFEFTLIQKALETKDTSEAAKRLQFLVKSGVIKSLDSEKINQLAEDPGRLPSFPAASAAGATR